MDSRPRPVTPPEPTMAADLEELTALAALGVLSDSEAAELEKLRNERRAETSTEAKAYEEAAVLIATSLQPVEPPALVRSAVLAAVQLPSVVRATESGWIELFPGVHVRKLRSDRQRRTVTSLLRLAPGAVYPGHHHQGAEESFVVSGSCRFGTIDLGQGDFIRIEPGGGHGDVTTAEGCLLLVVSDWADYAA